MDFPLGSFLPESIGPYIGLMAAGFFLGAFGHLARLRWLVAIGVIMIMLATLLLPLALQFFSDEPPPPGPDVPIARTMSFGP
jgi:predicted benzoate:H+ symporter BenE